MIVLNYRFNIDDWSKGRCCYEWEIADQLGRRWTMGLSQMGLLGWFAILMCKDKFVEYWVSSLYGFGFSHLVFVAGVMYFAMLLIGWNSHYTMKKWTIDVGWTSTWVRIVNEWLAVCVYYAGSTDRVEKSEGSRRSQISKLEGDNRHCVC
ncbi:uncharacterized protein LOC110879830 isoform X1 [Helianthus annuus]|uniref:uncharacterized protein LOC110879830 isoform X1 n=1 Tax=Helianthus annuus TaxID=4232 RepID=UPI000B8F2958|nr:uncharacterized protein LOC110879830 isoform X1 [Helianthus annuus]XP_021984058.1 uncharacterized protein LOC110879830 isoform X1 [Helianthus annuus]XP_021984059.1 uncharacterized protein LOC110879830 isoform X1 [Helianthus annuus]XP_021984060.1 uncharacterized protein LOC110879830 isoform X1 [Helianthus annuus]